MIYGITLEYQVKSFKCFGHDNYDMIIIPATSTTQEQFYQQKTQRMTIKVMAWPNKRSRIIMSVNRGNTCKSLKKIEILCGQIWMISLIWFLCLMEYQPSKVVVLFNW